MKYEKMETQELRSKVENQLSTALAIALVRKNIENQISTLLSNTFKRVYSSSEDILKQLNKLIGNLDSIFLRETPETIQQLLGWEFNKDSIYLGSDFEPEKTSMPLYLCLDLLIRALESNLLNKTKYNDQFIEILKKLTELKESATKLEFNPIFNPNNEFDESTMQQILDSKGNFELKKDKKEGIDYLGIVTNWENTPGYVKNGDYYQTGPTTRGSSKPMTLYQKDADAIAEVQYGEIKRKSDKLKEIANKYFKDGKIPLPGDFHYQLINNNLDKRIVSALFSFSVLKSRNFYDIENVIYKEFEELEQAEKIVEEENLLKEKENQRNNAIESARERYKSKNFFWKMFNKKLNPRNLNFDDMTTEELDALYQKRR